MLEEMDTVMFVMEDDDSNHKSKKGNDSKERNVAYTNLNTSDLDDAAFRVEKIDGTGNDGYDDSDHDDSSDHDEQGNGDLLEPFPEIDHDRRPKEADVDGAADDGDEAEDTDLRPGDHVYVWKAIGFLGVKTYQKHGIILSVDPDDTSNVEVVTFYHKNRRHHSYKGDDDDDYGDVDDYYGTENANQSAIDTTYRYRDDDTTDQAQNRNGSESLSQSNNSSKPTRDFLNRNGHESKPSSSSTSTSFTNSPHASIGRNQRKKKEPKFTATVRIESLYAFASSAKSKIRKVKYNQPLAKRVLRRGGTVTSCRADEPGLILARVRYLLEPNPENGNICSENDDGEQCSEEQSSMPDFHMMSANGECAAVWCRIGRWCTLQGSSILHILFVGQAGGAVAGGAIAGNVMLWAPMPGFWGSIGYVWYVPATMAFPILVPIFIGFGLASLVPLEILRRFRKKWAQISHEMNTAFWAKADDDVRQHYFASSCSADENWMKKFFMDDAKKKEKDNKGRYMPLGGGAEVCGDDSEDDDEDEDEWTKRVTAEYGMSSAQGGQQSEEEFREKWKKKSAKEKWQKMTNRMNAPFGKHKHDDKIRAIPDDTSGSDDALPLKNHDIDNGSCREIL